MQFVTEHYRNKTFMETRAFYQMTSDNGAEIGRKIMIKRVKSMIKLFYHKNKKRPGQK